MVRLGSSRFFIHKSDSIISNKFKQFPVGGIPGGGGGAFFFSSGSGVGSGAA